MTTSQHEPPSSERLIRHRESHTRPTKICLGGAAEKRRCPREKPGLVTQSIMLLINNLCANKCKLADISTIVTMLSIILIIIECKLHRNWFQVVFRDKTYTLHSSWLNTTFLVSFRRLQTIRTRALTNTNRDIQLLIVCKGFARRQIPHGIHGVCT